MKTKRLFVLASHDLTSEVYWTGKWEGDGPVVTRDDFRSAAISKLVKHRSAG